MINGIEFFTATCLNWQVLLQPDERKQIVMDSLRFMVNDKRIWLYGFVIMPNHIHLMWCRQDAWVKSSQSDRLYHFWERRPYKATMYNRKVAAQKIDYMHYNPVKAGLCRVPEDYWYSSYRFYELNQDEWGFLTHYEDHL